MRRLFARASICGKIIAAFALVLCCTIGLGLFAVQRLGTVDAAAADIRDIWLPSTRVLGELSYLSTRFRQLEATHALATTAEAKASEAKILGEVRTEIEKTFATYVSLISPGEERQRADEIARAWAIYLDLDAKFLAVSQGQDSTAAATFYRGEMRTIFNRFQDVLEADITLNVNEGAKTADRGAALGSGARTDILAVLGGMVVLCLLNGWLLVRGISGPITAMTAAMRRLANQDLAVEVPGVGHGDEIGAMAGAMQVFKDNALHARQLEREQAEAQARRVAEDERVRAEAEAAAATEAAALVVGSIGTGLARLAAGDLTCRLEQALPPTYEKLRTDLNAAMGELQAAMGDIISNTHAIRSGTGEIAQATDDLSRRTEQQAASLEETAAALDEITATVKRTAEGAKQAREVVSRTKQDAEHSGQVVSQAVAAMGEIEKSSQQVGQIIGVIDEIAFQTNLLALNAGVEAARAGEAGRGFAVVASEVRALAQRSAEAAREIKALISASGQQVSTGVKLVAETGQALGRIVGQVAELNSVVAEIASSASEQATGLAEVNTAVNQMDQVVQQNAAMVEESTAAAHALAQETEQLAQLTRRFQLGREAAGPAAAARKPAPTLKPVVRGAQGRTGSAVRKPAPAAAAASGADQEGWEEF